MYSYQYICIRVSVYTCKFFIYLAVPCNGHHEQMQHNKSIKIVNATKVAKNMSSQNSNLFSALYRVCKEVVIYLNLLT